MGESERARESESERERELNRERDRERPDCEPLDLPESESRVLTTFWFGSAVSPLGDVADRPRAMGI